MMAEKSMRIKMFDAIVGSESAEETAINDFLKERGKFVRSVSMIPSLDNSYRHVIRWMVFYAEDTETTE